MEHVKTWVDKVQDATAEVKSALYNTSNQGLTMTQARALFDNIDRLVKALNFTQARLEAMSLPKCEMYHVKNCAICEVGDLLARLREF